MGGFAWSAPASGVESPECSFGGSDWFRFEWTIFIPLNKKETGKTNLPAGEKKVYGDKKEVVQWAYVYGYDCQLMKERLFLSFNRDLINYGR